ncbi:LysR family transcriptional regulator [Enterovibrio sp. ZSDZ35]|uniref:LysR family transcriptional regulator n=1 Tax=Enterovibrio qingdaonensis TaxID=2899818 RepID=A0ABT5QKZ7_9GAMM|nr:LysR family transcriptional regulator [Enterovibrio sp. ZSDZ35]MDD1781662.1 LysR family transcriptional regulator [Enterovibrio sp. ZSDZ35]
MMHLDPKLFRAFKAVAESRSFNDAAEMAAMTQANISKHIRSLEEQVGYELFIRTPKCPVMTDAGKKLLQHIKNLEDLNSDFSQEVETDFNQIEGVVAYAMPPSCLLSPHFPMLLERRLNYPRLEIDLTLIHNSQVFDNVLSSQVDFGFVTEKVDHPRLEYFSFCQEEYVMVAAPSCDVSEINEDNILDYNYIEYPGMDVYFNFWRRHFYPNLHSISDLSVHFAGRINSIEGAILMVLGGLGVSVFPRHCVQQYIDEKKLEECNVASPITSPLVNDIYIIKLNTFNQPKRVDKVISWFMDISKGSHK